MHVMPATDIHNYLLYALLGNQPKYIGSTFMVVDLFICAAECVHKIPFYVDMLLILCISILPSPGEAPPKQKFSHMYLIFVALVRN